MEATDLSTDLLRSILSKSTTELKKQLTQYPSSMQTKDSKTVYRIAVTLAMAFGWQEGLEILLRIKLPLRVGPHRTLFSSATILDFAILSATPGIVGSVLAKRRKSGRTSTLKFCDLESAVLLNPMNTNAVLCQTHLVKQRRQIEKLIRQHLDSRRYLPSDCRVLDAGTRRALAALISKGVKIKLHLYSHQASIYHQNRCTDTIAAERLYSAGFRDVQASCFRRDPSVMPPFLWCMTSLWLCQFSRKSSIYKWFLSKGAKLSESWRMPSITAWKILAYSAGTGILRDIVDGFADTSRVRDFLLSLLAEEVKDSCSCACSPEGCSAISLFLKGGLSYAESRSFSQRQAIFVLVSWIAPIVRARRYLMASVLRILTFWYFQCNHVCCDIQSLLKGCCPWLPSYGWYLDAYRRFCLNRLQRHQELISNQSNGENLNERQLGTSLDQFVQMMDTKFKTRGQDIVPFIMDFWSTTLLQKAQALATIEDKEHRINQEQLGVKLQPLDLSQTGLVGDVSLDDKIIQRGDDGREYGLGVKIRDAIPDIQTLDEREWVMPPQDSDSEDSDSEEESSAKEIFPDDGMSPWARFEKLMTEAETSDDDSDDESSEDESDASEDDVFVDAES